jgi:hypothetical protein
MDPTTTAGCKQSSLNPVFEQAALERERVRGLNIMRHRLLVESLYSDINPRPSPEYDKVAGLCKRVVVGHEVRPFMGGIYEDREMVERFPAFHILLDAEWEMTVYTAADVEEGLYSISGQGSPAAAARGKPGFWSSLFSRVLGRPQMPQIRRRIRVLGSEGL